MNNSDPAIALPTDQCVLAENVEWVDTMLGQRRLGSVPVALGGSLATAVAVAFLHRHLPSSDITQSELYVMGGTAALGIVVGRKTSTWADVTLVDLPFQITPEAYQWEAVTLHGKSFFAYKSGVNRLHCVEGAAQTTMRRTGLAMPAAGPAVVNTAVAGTYAGIRSFRVRDVVQAAGIPTRRSEPSPTTTFTPAGTFTGAVITKPAATGEGATHWEVDASTGGANFYRLATLPVGTTTYTDTTAYVIDYTSLPLSEDIGDNTNLPSARYLTVDEDRLIWGGCYEDEALQSTVGWTPVHGATGVGNDERMELDTDPTLNLDGYKGGALTGLTSPVLGSVLAFKYQHIYKLLRTGERNRAYQPLMLTDARGAISGSVVEGLDEHGRPCVYFLDPFLGPSVFAVGGIFSCGMDIFETWRQVNLEAVPALCRGIYYPNKRQVHWWLATGSNNLPTVHVVLHVQHMREGEDGYRKGWAVWTGPIMAICACLYADNIDTADPRSKTGAILVGLQDPSGGSVLHRLDVGSTDSGTPYRGRIVDQPRTHTTILDNSGIMTGALLAKAVPGGTIDVKVQRDFGLETETVQAVPLSPVGSETSVIRRLDNLAISECAVFQLEFADPATPSGARWALNQCVLRGSTEQRT